MPLFWPLEIRVMHFAISYQYCEISMVQNLRTVIWVQLKVRLSLKVHHEAQIEARKHVAFRKPPTFLFFMNCEMEFETKSIPHRTVKRGLISYKICLFSVDVLNECFWKSNILLMKTVKMFLDNFWLIISNWKLKNLP